MDINPDDFVNHMGDGLSLHDEDPLDFCVDFLVPCIQDKTDEPENCDGIHSEHDLWANLTQDVMSSKKNEDMQAEVQAQLASLVHEVGLGLEDTAQSKSEMDLFTLPDLPSDNSTCISPMMATPTGPICNDDLQALYPEHFQENQHSNANIGMNSAIRSRHGISASEAFHKMHANTKHDDGPSMPATKMRDKSTQ